MRTAYNTIIYNSDELEKAIEDISKAGYDGIELFPKQINCRNVSMEKLEGIKNSLKAKNLDLACLMAGFLEDERSLGYIENAYNACQILGCKYMFVLPPERGKVKWKIFIELAKEACSYGTKRGITLTIHHHVGTIVETLDEILMMVRQIDSDTLGICFDSAHYLLCNNDLKEGIEKIGKWIKYVHLKDLVKNKVDIPFKLNLQNVGKEFTDLGEGILNFSNIIRDLKEIGYDGWFTVEIENKKYEKKEHARRNLEYIDTLMKGDSR